MKFCTTSQIRVVIYEGQSVTNGDIFLTFRFTIGGPLCLATISIQVSHY